MEPKFCHDCGHSLVPQARFCSACGILVKTPEEGVAPLASEPTASASDHVKQDDLVRQLEAARRALKERTISWISVVVEGDDGVPLAGAQRTIDQRHKPTKFRAERSPFRVTFIAIPSNFHGLGPRERLTQDATVRRDWGGAIVWVEFTAEDIQDFTRIMNETSLTPGIIGTPTLNPENMNWIWSWPRSRVGPDFPFGQPPAFS